MTNATNKSTGYLIGVMVLSIVSGTLVAAENGSRDAKTNFMLQCQGCHRADGAGIVGSVPDLRTYGRLFLTSGKGRRYYVSVPGSANAPLSNDELADVLNYIIDAIIMPADGSSKPIQYFDESEVGNYRQEKIVNVAQFREDILGDVSIEGSNDE